MIQIKEKIIDQGKATHTIVIHLIKYIEKKAFNKKKFTD